MPFGTTTPRRDGPTHSSRSSGGASASSAGIIVAKRSEIRTSSLAAGSQPTRGFLCRPSSNGRPNSAGGDSVVAGVSADPLSAEPSRDASMIAASATPALTETVRSVATARGSSGGWPIGSHGTAHAPAARIAIMILPAGPKSLGGACREHERARRCRHCKRQRCDEYSSHELPSPDRVENIFRCLSSFRTARFQV